MGNVIPGNCWNMMINDHDVSADCIDVVAARLLGYLALVLAVVTNVPQVLQVVEARSSAGISASSIAMQVFGNSVGLAYAFNRGLPFSAYGEAWVITAQLWLIVYLMHRYPGYGVSASAEQWSRLAIGFCAYIAAMAYCLITADAITLSLLQLIQSLAVPNVVLALLPQIQTNRRNGHTGMLSETTLTLQVVQLALRVYTTLVELGPELTILPGFATSLLLNCVLLYQVKTYHGASSLEKKQQ